MKVFSKKIKKIISPRNHHAEHHELSRCVENLMTQSAVVFEYGEPVLAVARWKEWTACRK